MSIANVSFLFFYFLFTNFVVVVDATICESKKLLSSKIYNWKLPKIKENDSHLFTSIEGGGEYNKGKIKEFRSNGLKIKETSIVKKQQNKK